MISKSKHDIYLYYTIDLKKREKCKDIARERMMEIQQNRVRFREIRLKIISPFRCLRDQTLYRPLPTLLRSPFQIEKER